MKVEATNQHPAVGPMRQADAGLLNLGYAKVGPGDGRVAVLLHGWPYDIHSYLEVAPLLAAAGYRGSSPTSATAGGSAWPTASPTTRSWRSSSPTGP